MSEKLNIFLRNGMNIDAFAQVLIFYSTLSAHLDKGLKTQYSSQYTSPPKHFLQINAVFIVLKETIARPCGITKSR